MKTRIHRWLLGLMLLLLLPGTLLACLGLIGGIGDGILLGFRASAAVAMVVCAIPPALVFWGFRMLPELSQGVHPTLRRHLLGFYLAVLVYCGGWLFAPISHGDVEIRLFSTGVQVIGSIILIFPVLITLFTEPEKKRAWNPRPACFRPNRGSDRFVAWLASRIR